MAESKFFTTSDGVKLHYRIGGSGEPLVILSGFGQTTEGYRKNYPELEKHFTVIALDYRAHGLSEAPVYGWHIERLAKDFEELLAHLGLEKVNLLCHSMGNAVAWCYFSLFGQGKINKYILEDEGPCLLADPAWTEEEKETYTGQFRIPDQWSFPPRMPGQGSGELTAAERFRLQLVREHLCRDWRDIVPTIKCPTLVLMGGGSHFASQRLWDWLHSSIEGSQMEIISAEEGGAHGMHEENPDKFNEIVVGFLLG